MENINESQKVLISAKVPSELEEKLKRIAEEERRTVSNVVFMLLDTHPRTQEAKVNLPQAA